MTTRYNFALIVPSMQRLTAIPYDYDEDIWHEPLSLLVCPGAWMNDNDDE